MPCSNFFYFKKMKKLSILLIVTCLFSGIYAETPLKDVKLNELEVSAGRTRMYSNLGRIVSVIDKLDIEKAAVRSIDDLLDFVSGVDVRQRVLKTVAKEHRAAICRAAVMRFLHPASVRG